MRAGTLNEVISVEKPIVVTDEYGATKHTWQTYINKTKANIGYSTSNRTIENNEIVFAREVLFRVRIYHRITERMRIVWENRKYRILSLEKDKEKQQLTIKTELIND